MCRQQKHADIQPADLLDKGLFRIGGNQLASFNHDSIHVRRLSASRNRLFQHNSLRILMFQNIKHRAVQRIVVLFGQLQGIPTTFAFGFFWTNDQQVRVIGAGKVHAPGNQAGGI